MNSTFAFANLEAGSTYYFSASSYDRNGNESGRTEPVSVSIERLKAFLNGSEGFSGGCYISSTRPLENHGIYRLSLIFLLSILALIVGCIKRAGFIIGVFCILISLFPQIAEAKTKDVSGNSAIGLSAGSGYKVCARAAPLSTITGISASFNAPIMRSNSLKSNALCAAVL